MAKRWVSLLGETSTGLVPRIGEAVDPDIDPGFQPSDGRFYPFSALVGKYYGNRVFLGGRVDRLQEIAGLAVRGVRIGVVFKPIASATGDGSPATWTPTGMRFDQAVFALNTLLIGVPVDVDGQGGRFIVGEYTDLPAVDRGSWGRIPPRWTYTTKGVAGPGPSGTAVAMAVGEESYYATGAYTTEQTWQAPIGLVRQIPEVIDAATWRDWPGALVFVDAHGISGPKAVSVAFTKLELLVSEKPTWRVDSMETLVRVGDVHAIAGRCFYPVENDPIAGLPIFLRSSGGVIEFRQPGSTQWESSVVINTDGHGDFAVEYRAREAAAFAQSITIGLQQPDDGLDVSRLFAPRFSNRVQQVLVYTDAPQRQPDGTVCVTVPAIAEVPAVATRIEHRAVFAWDAGANSIEEIPGDCYIRMTMPLVVGVVCGLVTDRSAVEDFTRITHGWSFTTDARGLPRFDVIEAGATLGLAGEYDASTVFEIRRTGATVTYLVDEAPLHVSEVQSHGVAIVGSAIYGSGDSI